MITFIKKYWQGNYSLAFSFWLIALGLGLATGLFFAWLLFYDQSVVPPLIHAACLPLFVYPIWWFITLWSLGGLWRSASNYTARGSSKVWGYGAKLVVVVLLVNFVDEFIHRDIRIFLGIDQFL
jgi:hypothetical protein